MRRALAIILGLSAFPLVGGYHSHRHEYSNHGSSVRITASDTEGLTSCSQIEVIFDGERVPVVEEEVAQVASLRSLKIHPPQNSGVRVTGSDSSTFGVKTCKAMRGGDVRSITTSVRGDELTSDIPDDTDAVVYYIVSAPRNATLELETHNGEIGVTSFTGTLTAHTTNGPISLKDVNGTVVAEAQNGPVSFSGGSGTVKLDTQNGPLSIKLANGSWDGGALDAHAQNGPLSVSMPTGYRSGVVVETDGHGPLSCHAEACRNARRTWDEDDGPRRIELGSGTQVIHVSAGNGPVSVRERD